YNPATNGQGFFIIVFPTIKKIFLAWFTFDTVRPSQSVKAVVGEPGHRWLTALGDYAGGDAVLEIEATTGGVFNAGQPPIAQHLDGTIILRFSSCVAGTVTYDIPSIGRRGTVPIRRVALDNVPACQQLAGTASDTPEVALKTEGLSRNTPQAGAFKFNRGLNDAWYNPATNGQGFFFNVFPNIGKMFLAWFTFDTTRPAGSVASHIGDPGHRWITALGSYSGNEANLNVEVTKGGVFDAAPPAVAQNPDGTINVTMSDCKTGVVTYNIPSANLQGQIPIQRVALDNVATCESLQAQ
ncbi:MAG: hypothetical protein ACREO9_04755, partial [Lysobacterales bacterium]